ncbi:MAG: ABC transporter substrate-binding protein, partial [Fretibacterium sp.]|nr:ABC transporter substrate-binding protein [Fretibacterium sp.]
YFRNPVGTGPFKYKDWVKGERISLERFDDYHGKKANFREFEVLVLPDDSSRVIALETGKVDLIYGVPPSDVERLSESDKVKVVRAPGLGMVYFGMNTQKKPFSDPKVRIAMEHAINKEAYNAVVYQGKSNLPAGPLIFTASTFTPENVMTYAYDPAKAKELLKEAGYPDGFEMELWVSNFQDRVNGATVLQSMLAEVGIKVNIQVFESGIFDDRIKDGTADAAITSWGMQTNRDAGQFWISLFHSRSKASNFTFLNDPAVDEGLDKASTTVEAAARKALLQAVWERLDETHPAVALSVPDELYGARADLLGVEFYDGRLNYLGDLSIQQ